ncbi:hypothetical protein LINPERPRIM_LOCUS5796 [Linum perenne]
MADEFPDIPDLNNLPDGEEAVLFNDEDVQDTEDLAQRSLLMRIFWENPRPRLAIQASLNNQWNCNGQLRVFDAGLGLYQVLFPTVEKRNSILKNQPWGLDSNDHHNLPIPLILALPAPVSKPPATPANRSSPTNIMRSDSNQTGNQEEQKKKRIIQDAKGKEPVHKTQELEKPSYRKEVGISFKDPKPPADESEEEEDYSTTAESSWAPPPTNSNLEIGESSIANMLNNLDEFGSFLGDENVGSDPLFDSLEEEG